MTKDKRWVMMVTASQVTTKRMMMMMMMMAAILVMVTAAGGDYNVGRDVDDFDGCDGDGRGQAEVTQDAK